jgi:hypothetical protein
VGLLLWRWLWDKWLLLWWLLGHWLGNRWLVLRIAIGSCRCRRLCDRQLVKDILRKKT